MNFDSLQPIIMIFVRYLISAGGVWLVSRGFSEVDATTVVDQSAFILTGAIIAAGPAIYAAIKRPSALAMETAKAVDQQIPKGEDVVLKTPGRKPDITIRSAGKRS